MAGDNDMCNVHVSVRQRELYSHLLCFSIHFYFILGQITQQMENIRIRTKVCIYANLKDSTFLG